MPIEPIAHADTARIISPNLDLDQTNLMLQYKNMNNDIVDVIPPWGSGATTTAPDNIRFDHFTQDGWVVVYNMFENTITKARPVLVLYNKYRGILRWWWWNDVVPPFASDFLTYALMIDGQNTSALNFTGELAKNYNVRSPHPFTVKTNTAQFNQGLLQYAWYYFDTEFAYDPIVAGQPQTAFSLALNGWATSQALITLQGDINGTINGTIAGSGKNASLIGTLIGSISSSHVEQSVTIMDNGQKAKTSLEDKINTAIGGALSQAIMNGLNALATQGLNMITSPLANLFGGLISSGQDPGQKVNLALAAKINMNGTLTTQSPAIQLKFALPGTARGDESGFLPYYNETMGLFNLAAPPVVRWKVVTGMWPPPGPGQKDVQYFPVTPTVILNPAIANQVTLGQVVPTVVYIKQYSGKETFYNPNYLAPNSMSNFPVINNVMGNVWLGFSAPYAVRYDWWTGTPEENIVVKVAFTVSPTNGAAPVEVVKFYRATFQPY